MVLLSTVLLLEIKKSTEGTEAMFQIDHESIFQCGISNILI